ncbi:hypothetical protein IEZ26_17780 [Nocardioides cavernae]|uniref:DUF485 domain-containing protein n=1 Tax=Nocardioides cavernae TaxID=1921566 RepID=A0ABR8NJ63_9ACTN|nr:hypothetical protein [Nocardioides cavernae]MBD3926479.1 hypothetical protein [Nocardioides cavernae]MBM7512198.1 hypothetical protein [Nocardioides cavernae]
MIAIIVTCIGALAALIPAVAALRGGRLRRLERQLALYKTLPSGKAKNALRRSMNLNATGVYLAERRKPGSNMARLGLALGVYGIYLFLGAMLLTLAPEALQSYETGVSWLDDPELTAAGGYVIGVSVAALGAVVAFVGFAVNVASESPQHYLEAVRLSKERAKREATEISLPAPEGPLKRLWFRAYNKVRGVGPADDTDGDSTNDEPRQAKSPEGD